jgi:FtsP/CotA-like multicopper oxidase with cupredoxin domain
MTVRNGKLRSDEKQRSATLHARRQGKTRRRRFAPLWHAAASTAAALSALQTLPAHAQTLPAWQGIGPQYVQCPAPAQPLLRIPELVSQNGKLSGTLVLSNVEQRMYLGAATTGTQTIPSVPLPSQCLLQPVRQFRGVDAVLPNYPGIVPPNYPGYAPPPSYPGYQPLPPGPYLDPVPGPTLRARLGDIVQLTFLNQIGSGPYWDTIDRGEKGQGCDRSAAPYPGLDEFPDCFHGSSTGNIHFHGTHTNPGTTGDNVFIEVRPSLRNANGEPIVTPESVRGPFTDFFNKCETELNKSVVSQWPRTWDDMPKAWRDTQEQLLKRYDTDPVIINKLWPVDDAQIKAGAWPQYYIGATPYCFRLPAYQPPAAAQSAHPPGHAAGTSTAEAMDQARALQMGQAPGTHWYHAHKHGSTTINVSNGMTGAFIIEGGYDDALNTFYNVGWTGQQPWARSQPVLVVNQLGTAPNVFGGGSSSGGPLPFSVNGRFTPTITMQPGQVQLWRIANTSSRGGIFVAGFAPATATTPSSPQVFAWKQTAQDGVQFTGPNYQNSQNPNLMIFPANRADLLVQAPTAPGQYVLLASLIRSRCEALPGNQIPTIPTVAPAPPRPPYPSPICAVQPPAPFLFVNVSGPPAAGNQTQFIPPDLLQSSFPAFLKDIADDEVTGTKTVVFESTPTPPASTPHAMHTIDGKKFDGNIGQVVLLNTVEEWKIVNRTVNGAVRTVTEPAGVQVQKVVTTDPPGVVDHPFHIHINPFQIVEFFDPNEVLPGTSTYKYVFFVGPLPPTPLPLLLPGQCLLDVTNPATWKPCDPQPKTNLIWWDVFAIPSARAVFINNNTQSVTVPGYFKMRSRFVDFTGQYVIHCHILAHEDRGMMTVVEVVPFTTAYSHK